MGKTGIQVGLRMCGFGGAGEGRFAAGWGNPWMAARASFEHQAVRVALGVIGDCHLDSQVRVEGFDSGSSSPASLRGEQPGGGGEGHRTRPPEGMTRRAFHRTTLQALREMPSEDALALLAVYSKADPTYLPVNDPRSRRWYARTERSDFELITTGPKWWDTRAKTGGGGAINCQPNPLRSRRQATAMSFVTNKKIDWSEFPCFVLHGNDPSLGGLQRTVGVCVVHRWSAMLGLYSTRVGLRCPAKSTCLQLI